ncbi:MAG: hypothetical protein NWS15_05720 [Schleiferiaceae bacterium]|nr:hypothetical protein [Schleiferiaceae bacterium]
MNDYQVSRVIMIAVAFNTAANYEEPCVDPESLPGDYILMLMRGSTDYLGGAYADPTTILPTINGNATVYKVAAARAMHQTNACVFRGATIYNATVNTESICLLPRTSAIDLTNSHIMVTCYSDVGTNALKPYATGGSYVGFTDGTNGEVWKVYAKDTLVNPVSGAHAVVIGTDQNPYDSNGTIAWNAITGIIIGSNTASGTIAAMTFGMAWKLNTLKLIGGSVNRPCSFIQGYGIYDTGRFSAVFNHKSYTDSQYTSVIAIQIGESGKSTYWKSIGQSLAFPGAWDEATLDVRVKIASASIGLEIYAQSGDAIDLTSTTINCGNYHKFGIHTSSHNSNIYTFTSCLVLNATVTLRSLSNIVYAGLTFSGCKEITHNGALLTGVSINKCVDTQAVTITSEAGYAKLLGATFKNNNRAILITGNQTHTGAGWADAELTVSGNTYDIEYTGATNFSIQSAATLNILNSGAGTLTVVTPSIDIIINSSEASSLIQIFTTTTQTVIASTTGASLTYTYTGTPTYDIVIQKAGFLPQRFVGEVMPGNTITYTITLVADPVYDASHGLTYTTDASWSRSLNQLTVPTFGPSVRGVYSLLIDAFIAETSLRNTAFNIQMVGFTSMFLVEGAEGASDANITKMTAGGVRYVSGAGATTAEWVGVESVGTIPGGAQGEYQQVDGSGTADARATGKFDEIIKMYGDASHGNFDYRSHLILKYQINGYREVRSNVLDTYGIGTLEPTLYIVAMEPKAIVAAVGDPALTITITDHGASPVAWNGKNFAITITDNASPSTAEDILRELNYNISLDATYQSKDPFNWPEMVLEEGSAYGTIRGYTEGAQSSTFKGVRVVKSDGTTPHAGFTRFQSDDGTYYTPAVTSQINLSGMPTTGGSIRLQIHNETAKTAADWATVTAYTLGQKVKRTSGLGSEYTGGLYFVCTTAGTTGGSEPTWNTTKGGTTSDGTVTWTTFSIVYYDANPGAASLNDSYIDGEEFKDGDTYLIRFAALNGATSFSTYESTGLVGALGFSVVVSAVTEPVYGTNALDGSGTTITNKFTADYASDYIVLDTNTDFAGTEAYAYYCYELTTSAGMFGFWGGVTAIDTGNYRINNSIVDIYFDETTGFVKQTDNVRIFRADGARPAIDPTTGGNGIEINWKNPAFAVNVGGSALTTAESNKLLGLRDFDPDSDIIEGANTYQNALIKIKKNTSLIPGLF